MSRIRERQGVEPMTSFLSPDPVFTEEEGKKTTPERQEAQKATDRRLTLQFC
jgi:hypothetical protein